MSLCNQTIPRHKFPVSTSNSDVFPDTAKRSLLSLTQQCSGIFAPLCLFSILLYQGRVSFVNNIYAFSFIWLCRFFYLNYILCNVFLLWSFPSPLLPDSHFLPTNLTSYSPCFCTLSQKKNRNRNQNRQKQKHCTTEKVKSIFVMVNSSWIWGLPWNVVNIHTVSFFAEK